MMAVKRYATTQNETASRERLMLLLFDTALREIRAAATTLDQKKTAAAAQSICHAVDIVAELIGTLDDRRAPDLCKQLRSIYLFVQERLFSGLAQRSAVPLREAERVFTPIVDAFNQAVEVARAG